MCNPAPQDLLPILLALRAGRAATAERALRPLLAGAPEDAQLQWLVGAALLELGRPAEGRAHLEQAVQRAPGLVDACVDHARLLRALGESQAAVERMRRLLASHPGAHRAWLALGDALAELGRFAEAQVAFGQARLVDPQRPRIDAATAAMVRDERQAPELIFRDILRSDPAHVGALCGLAALSLTADKPYDAERLLRHALRQSAHLPLAWRGLGPTLTELGRLPEAEAAARHLMQLEPENPQSFITLANVATRLLRQDEALAAYEEAVRRQPGEVRLHLSIGHVQKTLGNRAASEAAYARALELAPDLGEAWWSLADLKNYDFSDAQLERMQAALAAPGGARADVAQLHFALGKALEQRARYGAAFAHYAAGNALRRQDAPFDIAAFERRGQRIRSVFDATFSARQGSAGDPRPDPIFIVGLPRSGSTLIEQILASHPAVEGTMELPNVLNFVRELDDLDPARNGYPETARRLGPGDFAALGARYLAEVASLRHGTPRFTDKMPNNFSHVGLIRAILPHATIIDARRHPLDACFSAFKQYFARGQHFSYDLEILGRYYRSYLGLMDHWEAVLPGAVLCVQYESLVRDPEPVVRRLLEHCGLPFDPACLEFHRTRRPVRTASAEQVRQPLYTSGVGHWRHFERELQPLIATLGDALARFDGPC